jgi:AcrR family transcriptional regulator
MIPYMLYEWNEGGTDTRHEAEARADCPRAVRRAWICRRQLGELVAKPDVTRGALYHHYDGKEGVFEAVVDTVMQEVHAKLVTEMAALSDPLQALERGIGVFLEVCSEPSVQRILLVDAPAVLGWPKWRDMDAVRIGADQAGSVRSDESGVDGSTGRRRPRASSVGSSDGGGNSRRPIA